MRSPVGKLLRPELTLGFTLAELLVSLAILGVIATFTIPKILVAQQNQRYNAAAKEIAATISAAYQRYKLETGSVPASTTLDALLPYLNYIKRNTSSLIQNHPDGGGTGTWDCSGGLSTCLDMPAGGVLFWLSPQSFNGTSSTNGIVFYYDPDGVASGTNTPENPSVTACFIIYYDGRVVDRNAALVNTTNSSWNLGPCTTCNPNWFSWN